VIGILNANDEDSDGDGCLDIEESLNNDKNKNGIPDPYDGKTALCNSTSSMSSGGGGMSSGMNGNSDNDSSKKVNNINNDVTGGGNCSLVKRPASYNIAPFCLVFFVVIILIFKKMKKINYFRKMDGSDKMKRIYEEEKR